MTTFPFIPPAEWEGAIDALSELVERYAGLAKYFVVASASDDPLNDESVYFHVSVEDEENDRLWELDGVVWLKPIPDDKAFDVLAREIAFRLQQHMKANPDGEVGQAA